MPEKQKITPQQVHSLDILKGTFQKSRLQRAVLTFKCIGLYFITFPMAQTDYNVQRLLIFLIAE